jgi:hypothetical protein
MVALAVAHKSDHQFDIASEKREGYNNPQPTVTDGVEAQELGRRKVVGYKYRGLVR